jgi:hypothetical protein
MFCTNSLTFDMIVPFLDAMVNLLTSSLDSSRRQVVHASASGIFNLSRKLLEEDSTLGEDNLIHISVRILETLRGSTRNGMVTDGEVARLLIICLGGMIVNGTYGSQESNSVIEILRTLDAPEIISHLEIEEAREILSLLGGA